ncbi:glucose-1-phosphate thymidylyltransferase [Prochlorococcus marinus str. XMU1401]|uniref:Glucose-1-phosphate thymidylyltransferase n=1 Tax=Prochlorococcus marinus str. XMU1401 TaxID=2052594 RepID=A0A8I1X6V7_PROMR|nr:glucose-1-phosphate thymidylyltransferase RfbA [Prochlorococcus marinus]MBO8223275.1 glucose-1-phosphate thymidylyltransferase RfbA [Prochlorococcus marinus str. XMU1401]MBW3059807.1 glucose-1-phosphate thymidylyltransferase [Prochlorococcus marinus str. XMU1401E]MCQ9198967.1 glucose-1-phosphate thymidylyltransferase RfbA [Prochlorococcus marinus XMU1429]PJC83621.1 glucose-1-phosphate thymidylyltransferase [Prochlorococcus marinus str. XMU1401]
MKERKGIILAGGKGTRLYPLTKVVSKQLMPVYDKPMIFYPLTTLIQAGIKDILIIINPFDQDLFERLLGDGNHLGIKITYKVQQKADGLAQAFLIGKEFIGSSNVALILGDNLFHGETLETHFTKSQKKDNGATVFAYPVKNPERYGVANFDNNGNVVSIEEKPKSPKSKFAITGIYFFDNSVVEKAEKVKPSDRGELEITDLIMMYLEEKTLHVEKFGSGIAWLDTGSHESLLAASSYVKIVEERQGLKLGCPEEISWRKGLISDEQLIEISKPLLKSGYGNYLMEKLNLTK